MKPPENPGHGRRRMTEIFTRGVGGQRPSVPVAAAELKLEAEQRMSPEAWAYIGGSAGSESTARRNRRAFERWRIVPRMLAGITEVDLSVEIFGRRWPLPLVLSPVGVLELFHPEADLAVARAAAAEDVPMVFSNQASVTMEACSRAMGNARRWFQLYWSSDDDLVVSFLERAESCGCEALVITLDTSILGWRPRDLDLGSLPFLRGMGLAQYLSDPVFRSKLDQPLNSASTPPKPPLSLASLATLLAQKRRYPGSLGDKLSSRPMRAVRRFMATYSRPSLRWDDLPWLREHTRLPILLKGILDPDDARRALDHGVDGLYVSNHGGRQVDGAIGAFEALPSILEAVDGRVPVILDSGIRGGADIFKAVALGASAVGIGRPFAFGLAIDGESGVREVLRNLIAELELTTLLSGHAKLADVSPEALLETAW
ncbi:MAG: alpha-hydroxy-acid oxidizing protein [Acidobacteriota bacterium]